MYLNMLGFMKNDEIKLFFFPHEYSDKQMYWRKFL